MAEFFAGKDITAGFFFNGAPVNIFCKSFTIDEDAVEVSDGVNGEPRQRYQKITNGYNVSIECYQADSAILDAYFTDIANNDAGEAQLNKNIGFKILFRDGTKYSVSLKGVTWGPLAVNSGGRTERVMASLKFKCQYFQSQQAA